MSTYSTSHHVLVATRPHRNLSRLLRSCKDLGHHPLVLACGDERIRPGARGLGVKLVALKDYVDKLVESGCGDDVVLLTDAYDVVVVDTLDDIVDKFRTLASSEVGDTQKHVVLLSAELGQVPYPELAHKYGPISADITYPFVNSGGIIGTASALATALAWDSLDVQENDQGFWTRLYWDSKERGAAARVAVLLDHEALIFMSCHKATHHLGWDCDRQHWRNRITGTSPSVIHFNEGSKVDLDKVWDVVDDPDSYDDAYGVDFTVWYATENRAHDGRSAAATRQEEASDDDSSAQDAYGDPIWDGLRAIKWLGTLVLSNVITRA